MMWISTAGGCIPASSADLKNCNPNQLGKFAAEEIHGICIFLF
jgi:hypothetical protein